MSQTPHARGAQAYYQTHVQSRSPLELVVMLYDGALRFLGEARDAMARRDLVTKARSLSRALAILAELQSTLDLEAGGQVAVQLDALYSYITGKLLEANIHGDPVPIEEALRLLETLRSAWAEVAARPTIAA